MTTVIDHDIRIRLKLNCIEYCIASLSNLTTELYPLVLFFGLSPKQANDSINSLIDKNIIELIGNNYIVTDKWKNEFRSDDKIDLIWKIHPTGSKSVCRTRLTSVLKKISIEDLCIKLKEYLSACKETNTYSKNLETWLNPKAEHWLSPLPTKKEFSKPGNNQATEKVFKIKKQDESK
jgi:hypothetical protein